MKNLIKFIFPVLTFLSISEASAFSCTAPEVREELPFSSEDLKAVNLSLNAVRENPFQDISESPDKVFSLSPLAVPASDDVFTAGAYVLFTRDLRKNISQHLFPKHFFL